MDKLFILVEKTQLWLNGDKLSLLHSYFVEGTGFTNALLIALLWSVVGLLFFYLFIGMRSVRLSNVPVWLATLLVGGLLTWATTDKVVVGSFEAQTGFFQKAEEIRVEKCRKALTDEERNDINAKCHSTVEEMKRPMNSVSLTLNGTTTVFYVLFFFMGSLGVKRFTIHASAIPF